MEKEQALHDFDPGDMSLENLLASDYDGIWDILTSYIDENVGLVDSKVEMGNPGFIVYTDWLAKLFADHEEVLPELSTTTYRAFHFAHLVAGYLYLHDPEFSIVEFWDEREALIEERGALIVLTDDVTDYLTQNPHLDTLISSFLSELDPQ